MDIAVNDISFQFQFENMEKVKEALIKFDEITSKLKSDAVTEVRYIFSDKSKIIGTLEMAPNCKLITVLQNIRDVDLRRRVLQLLLNSPYIDLEGVPSVTVEKHASQLCYFFRDSFIVSLLSDKIFEKNILEGYVNKDLVTLRNISKAEHINEYRIELGIRVYERNPKHGVKEYIRAGGLKVEPMPLDDEEAQDLLNKATEIDGKLYAFYKGDYYQFPLTRDNTYHGFIRTDLRDDLKEKISKIYIH